MTHSTLSPTAPSVRDPFVEQGLHVMVKPIGPICNLDCEYCYYLHKEELYPQNKSWRMTPQTLRQYIAQYFEAQPPGTPEVTFAWQGGEPTLLGLEFFQHVVELQQELKPVGMRVANALQTNGVLLNDDWAVFFREQHFLIGLSIDGPAELHDHYRYDKQGRPTFAAVQRAMQLLKQHRVPFNALVVVNRHNGDHGRRVYTYLRDNGVEFLQFISIVERRGEGMHAEDMPSDMSGLDQLVSSRSVLPEQWGRFLIEVFDEWVRRDVGRVFVQLFDQTLGAWMGAEPSLCVLRKQCGRALAMEHNGDVYSCDHFVEPEYLLGNIQELPLLEIANSPQQRAFGAAKETTLPQYCRECEVLFACNGECPKNRFIETPEGEAGLNYLCSGYRAFFNHVRPAMELMMEEQRAGRHVSNVMHRLRGHQPLQSGGPRNVRPQLTAGTVGRNDPCPCGSGRKYKKCCFKG